MNLATFQVKTIDFAMEEIIPNMPAVPLNVLGVNLNVSPSLMRFGAGVGLTMSALNIEKYAPQLQAFGILNSDNEIDVEKLSEAMKTEIKKVGKIKIGDFEFDKTDVDNFVDYLKS